MPFILSSNFVISFFKSSLNCWILLSIKYEVESNFLSYLTEVSFNSIINLLSYSCNLISLVPSIIVCKSKISLDISSCNFFSLLQASTAFFNLMKLSTSTGFTPSSIKCELILSIELLTFDINTLGITLFIFSIHFRGASDTISSKSSSWNSNNPIFIIGFKVFMNFSFSWNSVNKSFNWLGVAFCSNSVKLIFEFFK